MGLTPDEIAHRAFTPSADGYHQGEVRSFLERIANELSGIYAALPDGRAQVAELAAAMHGHQHKLANLQAQLTRSIADLDSAAARVDGTGPATAGGAGAALSPMADDPTTSELAEIMVEQRALLTEMRAGQQALTQQLALARELNAAAPAAPPPVPAAEPVDELGPATVVEASAATTTPSPAPTTEPVSPAPSATGETVESAAPAVESAPATPVSASPDRTSIIPKAYTETPAPSAPDLADLPPPPAPPTPAAPLAPAPAAPTANEDALTLFASDLDDQPMFSENANHLLDGVLEDVMGDLTDEGSSS